VSTPESRADETIFTWGAPPLKFGAGAVDEIGFEMSQYGVGRVLIVADANVNSIGIPQRIQDQLAKYAIASEIFDGVHVEPTDDSLDKAAGYAREQGPWDGFVAVGGGSAIDTAKAVNLLVTEGGELMDYINAPIGRANSPRGQLKPLVAVPTTAGTGSESTAMCVLDVLSMRVKTGISHWRLRPTLAIIDPLLTMTLPPEVTACSGMDIVCHALESYTSRWFESYDRKQPEQRVTYCGANPISDLWAEQAMRLVARSFRAAVHDGANDVGARSDMMLAATFAGMGIGNSGVHIPHANAYPIAGMVKDFRPDGYPADEPMVPHGMSVSLTAPQAFRFTFDSAPERHLTAAGLLAPDSAQVEASERLPAALIELMRDIGIPSGIGAVGYTEADVADLVPGTMKQQRLLSTAPRTPTEDDLADIFTRSIENW
jgi:alcohol dehydrogenase class IV